VWRECNWVRQIQRGEILGWERCAVKPEFDSFGIDMFGIEVRGSFEEIN